MHKAGRPTCRHVTIMPELTPLGERSMGIARALCRLLRRELPLLALKDRSRLTRAERRLGLLTPYTHLMQQRDACMSRLIHGRV